MAQRTRQERRDNTDKKLKQREKLLKDFGPNEGILFERHTQKVNKSLGYMKDGNTSHYVAVGRSKKTKNTARHGTPKNLSYGKRYNYKPSDERQILRETDEHEY